jgi:ABC-type nitrate/sulfonate/bicarbonate transport system permease component
MKWTQLLFPVFLVLVWQCVAWLQLIPTYQFPSPLQIVFGFKDLIVTGMPPGHSLHNHIIFSLYRVFWGYMIAVILAIPLGILIGWSQRMRLLVQPILELIRPIPPLAWIPIAILWFGIGIKSAAFIIFLGAFFPILLNTTSGVLATDRIHIEAAWTLHASNKDIFIKILIPAAIPSILTGMRIGIGIGWMTLVAAEFTGVKQGYGLGYMIMTARDIHRPDEILAGMFIIGFIGFMIDVGLRFVERKLVQWK